MASSFECCVCKHREGSIGALHTHHIVQHSSEELSLALLWSHHMLENSSGLSRRVEDDILCNSLAKYPQFLITSSHESRKQVNKWEMQNMSMEPFDDSDTVVLMENKVEEENTKENINELKNKVREKQFKDIQKTKWKKSLVDRSQAEYLIRKEEETTHQLFEPPKMIVDNPVESVKTETSVGQAMNFYLPDIEITPDLAKQQPSVFLSLLEKINTSSDLSNAPLSTKRRKRCTQPMQGKDDIKATVARKNNTSPLTVYNVSILKNSTTTLPNKRSKNLTVQDESESKDPTMSQTQVQQKPYKQHTPDRKFRCNRCDCAYKKRSHLDRHMRSHTGERPFSCHICNKSFAVKSVLIQHIRIHTGEKPFVCSVCNARFPQTSGLMTHMMLHTGKPYKCDFCVKSFVSNHKLLHHLKSHEGTRPYICDMCNLGFFTFTALEEHKSIMHLNVKKFNCEICGSCFKHEVSLKVHLDGHIEELGGDEIIDQLAQQENTSDDSNH